MKKFSIIVPCYNCFDKIDKCMNSLLNQTFDDFEIIFVDDCSTDNTYNKLCKFKKKYKYSNVKIIKNEKNGGAGFSRNVGIDCSTGEYILFIDSDDYISFDTLFIASQILLSNKKIDCLIFDYLRIGKTNRIYDMIENASEGYVSNPNAFLDVKGCTCGKIYKKSLINENNVRFTNSTRNEDMPFTKTAISFCKCIYYYKSKPLYYYIMEPTSLMHNKNLLDENNSLIAFNYIVHNCSKECLPYINILFIKECFYSIVSILIIKGKTKQEIDCFLKKACANVNFCISFKYLSFFQRIIVFLYKHNCLFLAKIIFKLKEAIYD